MSMMEWVPDSGWAAINVSASTGRATLDLGDDPYGIRQFL
jgi:hypothetical protein